MNWKSGHLLRNFLSFVTIALVAATPAEADLLAYGSITRTTGSPYLFDSLNNRIWLGWDVARGYTYAQIQAATSAGGEYAGFEVGGLADAFHLTAALFGAGACSFPLPDYAVCRKGERSGMETILGENYYGPDAWLDQQDNDYVAFVNEGPNSGTNPFGFIETGTLYSTDQEVLDIYTVPLPQADIDAVVRQSGMGWLVYSHRQTLNAPEPSSLALFAAALAAAVGLRGHRALQAPRRKRSSRCRL